MKSYSFWNNKGGVGKSFLCFSLAGQLAYDRPESDIYVIDLCPQANVSETLLGGVDSSAYSTLISGSVRRTVGGYLEARLNDPFGNRFNVDDFVCRPHDVNAAVPENLFLVAGDNLLEILSEAIRQTSMLPIPLDAWKRVLEWVRDLTHELSVRSGERDALVLIDCNPSFAIYTQQALVASDYLVVPFTADDSSKRGIENILALLYGVGTGAVAQYAKINFSQRASTEGLEVPRMFGFVSNRVTMYGQSASKAFEAAANAIKSMVVERQRVHRTLFAKPPSESDDLFFEIPDNHSACVVSTLEGVPLHALKPGPHVINGQRIQINKQPLERYREAISRLSAGF